MCRASAEDLLHELRVVEDRGAFVVTADQLGLTPLDFTPLVRANKKVGQPVLLLLDRSVSFRVMLPCCSFADFPALDTNFPALLLDSLIS